LGNGWSSEKIWLYGLSFGFFGGLSDWAVGVLGDLYEKL